MKVSHNPERKQAFTLIELLVSMAVLALLMVMVFSMVDQTQKTWNIARSRVSQFREARTAFEAVTRSLSQATLNTYWDYDYGQGRSEPANLANPTTPQKFQRQSELHFVCGPSAKLLEGVPGTDNVTGHSVFFQTAGGFGVQPNTNSFKNLLNSRGYFVEYNDDSPYKPSFLQSETQPRWRFRLMEMRPPTEEMLVYTRQLRSAGSGGINANKKDLYHWFQKQVADENVEIGLVKRPIADNIIAAYFLPKFPGDRSSEILTNDYLYDSREWQYAGGGSPRARNSKNQLPPIIEITMVAIDEKSMIRYQQKNPGNKSSMPDFVPTDLFTNYTGGYQNFIDDLEDLKSTLDDAKISYRVFNQTVPMRGSGWSDSEA